MILTKLQRQALKRVFQRHVHFENPEAKYLAFRRKVEPGPGCIMVQVPGMWLGIEPDGYTHS